MFRDASAETPTIVLHQSKIHVNTSDVLVVVSAVLLLVVEVRTSETVHCVSQGISASCLLARDDTPSVHS